MFRDNDDELQPLPTEGVRLLGEDTTSGPQLGQPFPAPAARGPKAFRRRGIDKRDEPWTEEELQQMANDDQDANFEAVDDDQFAFARQEMPHWTDEPTGEVPAILVGLGDATAPDTGPIWREGHAFEDDSFGSVADLRDDTASIGALDSSRSDESDLFTFDFDDAPYRDVPTIDVRETPSPLVTARDREIASQLADDILLDHDDDLNLDDVIDVIDARQSMPASGQLRMISSNAPAVAIDLTAVEEDVDAALMPATPLGRTSSRQRRTTAAAPSAIGAPQGRASTGSAQGPEDVNVSRQGQGSPAANNRGANNARSSADFGAPTGPGRDLVTATVVGLLLAALATFSFVFGGPRAVVFLALIASVFAAIEVFDNMRRGGLAPVSVVGLVGVASLVLGAYWRGETALPLVLTFVFFATLAFHLFGVVHSRLAGSLGATLLGTMWVGFLGAFASLLLALPNRAGMTLVGIAIIGAVAYDTVGLLVGSKIGKRRLAPSISPSKTVEGLVAGMAACAAMVIFMGSQMSPLSGHMGDLFLIAIAISVMAPVGDLAQSMLKRDLGIKDSGSILPGHGGVFDRLDSLFFVLPTMYYLSIYLLS
jgi:phosphatidate cytidylyltransferase